MTSSEEPLQRSLFEENFLRRTLGSIATDAEIALTELVANAWDAGASRVSLTVPPQLGGELLVEDDGSGMTPGQFRRRWMTLGYDRSRHQGQSADFPPERADWRRRAYGRNGVGRHALLCFNDSYAVQSWRDGKGFVFRISTESGLDPFVLLGQEEIPGAEHGTRLSVEVRRNRPDPDQIRTVLSGRFVSNPQFTIIVNGSSLPLMEHEGLLDRQDLMIDDGLSVEVLVLELDDTSKRVLHHGVAFWAGGRLVGDPSWTIGGQVLLDGRTRLAKRHTIVVRGEGLIDLVEPDWTSFRSCKRTDTLFSEVSAFLQQTIGELARGHVVQTKEEVIRRHREEIKRLRPSAQHDVGKVVDDITMRHPTLGAEYVSVAVEAAIQIEKTRSGAELLERLAALPEEDVEGLNRLLGEWSVRDALTVLDEIDERIAVVEVLEQLSADPKVDELNTLHPLVAQARWLFGPEFDTPEYASNMSLVNAVKIVFKKRLEPSSFDNSRRRPDLVFLQDASLSVVSIEGMDAGHDLARTERILIVELKKGGSAITRQEMSQGAGYVEDFLACGAVDGTPYVRAFVVGHRVASRMQTVQRIGDPEVGRVEACTYGQLVKTASKRLFRLRERLKDRYGEADEDQLLRRVLGEAQQPSLQMAEGSERTSP